MVNNAMGGGLSFGQPSKLGDLCDTGCQSYLWLVVESTQPLLNKKLKKKRKPKSIKQKNKTKVKVAFSGGGGELLASQ